MSLPRAVQLDEFQSGDLFEREVRGPGTYTQIAEILGNSILSSVFIESIDPGATLKINYFDRTTGADVGERFELTGHALIDDTAAPLTTLRILVTRIHHQVHAEAVVTGGNVKFSLYATVVSSTASDLDQALKLDGQTANLATDKGIPQVVYDPTAGKWFFLRSSGGALVVTSDDMTTPFFAEDDGTVVTDPGVEVDLLQFTVPASTLRRLNQVVVSCSIAGKFRIYADAVLIGTGRLSPSALTVPFQFSPNRPITAGSVVRVTYEAPPGGPVASVEASLMASDLSV